MFKTGDLIECIEGSSNPIFLTLGKKYEIISQNNPVFVEVRTNDNEVGGWRASRFKLVPKIYNDGLDNWE